MIKKPMLEKLNEQLNHELASAYVYYAMAAYFESINLKGFANWMKIQAQEELTHVHKIYTYIIDRGARPSFGAHEAPKQEWKSALAAMEDAYKHECFISEKINECVTLALKEGDHPTNTMLQWFVNEQVEEESAADDVVQKLKLIGDNTSALFLLDNELAGRSFVDVSTAG